MKRIAGIVAGIALTLSGISTGVAHAHPASPPPPWSDPHYPDAQHGSCAGGKGGFYGYSYCDGEHYPDGSYWHQVFGFGVDPKPQCVTMPEGALTPEPAPAGGCDGWAQPPE